MASNPKWIVELPSGGTIEYPSDESGPSAFTKHLTQLGEDLVAAPKRLDESLTRITAPENVERFIASLPKMDPKMERYIDMEAYMGRPETIRKIAGLVQAGVAPGTLPEKAGRVMEESFRSAVPEGLVRAATVTPEGVTAFINQLPPSTAEGGVSNAERSEAEMASGLTPALARIGAGTYNAAVGLGAAMASPGGVATVAAPIVAGLPVAAKFGYDAIQRLPEMGRRIADYIEPPPQPTDYQKPGMPYPDVPDTGKPEHLEDLTTEALGDMFMAIAPVLGAAHAGSKLKEWKETRKASEEQQFRAASDSVANMQREAPGATREVPGAPGAMGSPEMEFTVESPEAGPAAAAAEPKPPTGPKTDVEYRAALEAADAPLDLDKAIAEGQKAAKEAEQNVAAQAEAAKAEARAKEMVDQEAFEAGREEVKRLQQEALEAAAIKEAQAEAARVAAIRDAQYTERVALDKADEAVAEVEIPAPGRVEVAAPTTPIPTLNEVAALETAYRTAADKLWAMKNGKAGRVSAAGIEANAVAVEAAKQRWQEANDLYRANRTPPKPQVTAPPDNPFIAKSKPAKAKPEPVKVSPHEALQDRIMELETDPETTKGAVMKVARKAAKDGLIDPRDLAEYERIAKDRDMGPEDITSLFRDDVEAARRKAATAPAQVTPARLTKEVKSDSGYVYHATNADRLAEIADSGKLIPHKPGYGTDQSVWPDGGKEARSYFNRKAEVVWQFAPEEGKPVIVRTREGAHLRTESTGDTYSRKPIPASALEYLGEDGQWHPVQTKPLTRGDKLPTIPSNEQPILEGKGAGTAPKSFRVDDPAERSSGRYRQALQSAADSHPAGKAVEVKAPEFYLDPSTLLFLAPDGSAGAAVSASGDLVSVFKRYGSKTDIRPILQEAAPHAITLDGYTSGNGKLPNLYGQFGFRPIVRLKFSRDVAPPGWKYELHGEPDVVFMVRDPRGVTGAPEVKGEYAKIESKIPLVDSYDAAVKMQQEAAAKVRAASTPQQSGPANFAALDRVGKAQGRMVSEQGGVAKELLQPMAGGIGGFLWGYSQNKDEPREVRVARAFGYGLLGVAIGSPALRAAVVKGVYNAKIPIGKLSKRAAANHFNNFVIFAQSVLGEMYNVIRSESALTASLAEKATRALGELEKQRDKAHPGDWYAMNQYLFNRGNPAFIADLKLRSHAITVRSTIDDLTLDLIGRGYAAPGSDLEMTMMLNLGTYLNRSYEIFTNPEFKFDPKNYSNFVAEYVKQEVLKGSTKPPAELETEAKDLAAHILAKGKGVVLAPNAVSFAQGKGIARTDGTMLMPRKELSDATAKLMGRIDDPLRAATITMDRMTRFVAASITQSQMAEIGLKTGLFTKHSTGGTSLPLSHYMPEIDHALAGHGPLAGLYAEPHVADALKTMQSYSINSWPLRALATTTGLMKISKTVLHPISWAPNLFTSIAQIVTQGSAARVLMHPSDAGMALRVVFDDVLPSSSAKVQADVPFLIRERILRQNVNLNDLVETAKASALSGLPGKRAITWVPDKVKGAVKATYKGALNGYGKMEEFPRVIGFYAEVDRYASALYNKKPSQLTTAEQAKVYDRAARVVRENYPNSSEIPDPIKKLSLAGILDPFVAFKYEVMFRTPYNTVKRAMSDIQEGRATGNNRLIAAGVNRLSWMVGTVGGVMAINAAFNATKGLKGEQDEAARRIQPIWDRTGSQIVLDLTPNEMAYANTSYLFPQALPGSAITAALAGKSAPEASVIFMQEAFGSMLGDGGLLLGSAVEAIGGTNAYGNRIYTRDAGAFVDISKIENRPIQDASLHAQQFAERLIHAFRNIVPGFWSEAVKWKKAAADEVGPDGQLYKTEDLTRRLGGIRINRLDLPLQYERKAGELSSRLREAATNFTKARERKDATPQSINAAYEIEEQSRKRVWNDVSQYLKDGVILQQSADKMIQNLRDAGLSSEFILSASYGFYIPGKKDKEMSVREQFQALMAMDAAKQDATWAALVKADPLTAKAMRPMIHEVAQGRTQEEKLILSLDANDGSRARMIARIVLMQPSPEAKEAKFNELVNRGLTKGMTHAQLKGPGSEKTWAEARATLGKP